MHMEGQAMKEYVTWDSGLQNQGTSTVRRCRLAPPRSAPRAPAESTTPECSTTWRGGAATAAAAAAAAAATTSAAAAARSTATLATTLPTAALATSARRSCCT